MPYKYTKEDKEEKLEPKITETKVIEPEKIKTEEESQIDYTQKMQKDFFDDDEEIIEVNWD